jgi:hypothetical protein
MWEKNNNEGTARSMEKLVENEKKIANETETNRNSKVWREVEMMLGCGPAVALSIAATAGPAARRHPLGLGTTPGFFFFCAAFEGVALTVS